MELIGILGLGFGALVFFIIFMIDDKPCGVQERILAGVNQCGICQKKGEARKGYILDYDWDGPSAVSYVHEECLASVKRNPEKFDKSTVIFVNRIFSASALEQSSEEDFSEDFSQYLARIWGKSPEGIRRGGVLPQS